VATLHCDVIRAPGSTVHTELLIQDVMTSVMTPKSHEVHRFKNMSKIKRDLSLI